MSARQKAPGGRAVSTAMSTSPHGWLLQESASDGTAGERDRNSAQRSIDELFQFVGQHTSTEAHNDLMYLASPCHFDAPFFEMSLHTQAPGETFVAPLRRWAHAFRSSPKPAAHPVALLQPMGPDLGGRSPAVFKEWE